MPNIKNNMQIAYEDAIERYRKNRPLQVVNRIPAEQLALEYRFQMNLEDFLTQTKHISKYTIKTDNSISTIIISAFFWLFVFQNFLILAESFSSENLQVFFTNLILMLLFCGLFAIGVLIYKWRKKVNLHKQFALMQEAHEADTPTKVLFYGDHIEVMNAARYKFISCGDAFIYELPDGIYISERSSDDVITIPARYFDADSAFQLYTFLNGDSNWKYFFKKRMQLPDRKETVENFTLVDTNTPQYEFNFVVDSGYVKKTETVKALKRVFFILLGGLVSIILVGAVLVLLLGNMASVFSGTVYLICYISLMRIVDTIRYLFFLLIKKRLFTGSVRVRFFENCFEQTEGNNIRRIPYSSIEKLRVTKPRTYVYTKDKKTYFVPESAFFVPEKRGEFDNFLKAHVVTK